MRTLGLKVTQTVHGGAVVTSSEEQEEAGCEVALGQQLHMNLALPQTRSDSSVLCNSFCLFLPPNLLVILAGQLPLRTLGGTAVQVAPPLPGCSLHPKDFCSRTSQAARREQVPEPRELLS